MGVTGFVGVAGAIVNVTGAGGMSGGHTTAVEVELSLDVYVGRAGISRSRRGTQTILTAAQTC